MKYNGHKNWNHWNVALWVGNDEGLYNMALYCIRCTRRNGGRKAAAEMMLDSLHECGVTKTPDGAPYSMTTIKAAMVDM